MLILAKAVMAIMLGFCFSVFFGYFAIKLLKKMTTQIILF